MTRSKWKHYSINENLLSKINLLESNEKLFATRTWDRWSTIPEEFIGVIVNVHTGNNFIPVKITSDHINHKLGEFAPTRKLCIYKKTKKKKII